MDKKLGVLLSFILLYLIYAQKDVIQTFFIDRYNSVKTSYFDTIFYLEKQYELHFNQAKTIQKQKKLIQTLTEQNLLNTAYKERFLTLKEAPLIKEALFVNAISYVNIANNNRLWVERFDAFEPTYTYGATDGKFTAGIVVAKNGKPMIILNSDPQAIYGVYIGEDEAPGVIYGIDHQSMVVKYIPQWMEIEKGDLVKTSGLDNIFVKGIGVGLVTSVENRHGYKVAYVSTYADSLQPEYFYLLK
ncbi:MAG: rod shape-determining protein MreC [Campylobacterota bacterium]